MDIQISLKRLLLTLLLTTAVITVPGISQAHEHGYHGDQNAHHYNRGHDRYKYRYSNHGKSHKHNKHHKYNKHHDYDHGRYYSSNKHRVPHHALTLHRKGLFFYSYN